MKKIIVLIAVLFVTSTHFAQHAGDPDVECSPNDKEFLTSHPTDCTKYIRCYYGRGYIEYCPMGLVFNPALAVCDKAHNVNCEPGVDRYKEVSPGIFDCLPTGDLNVC